MRRRLLLLLLLALLAAASAATDGHDGSGLSDSYTEVVVAPSGDVDAPPVTTNELLIADTSSVDADDEPSPPLPVAWSSHRDQFFESLAHLGIHLPTINASSLSLPAIATESEWREIYEALEAATVASYEFVRLWGLVLWRLAWPLARLLTAVLEALLPHFVSAVLTVAEAVYELDPMYQAALAVATVFAIVCYRQGYVRRARDRYVAFRRDMRHRYRAFVQSLSEKSRLVALAMPHVLFLVVVYIGVFWSPSIVMEVWDNASLTVVLSVGIPLVRSVRAIHQRRKQLIQANATNSSDSPTRPQPRRLSANSAYNEWRPYEACLKYWVLWSIVVCVSSVTSLFVPSFLAAYFAVPTYIVNILLAWMHSPVARGDIALYTMLSPLVNPYANRIRDATDYNTRGTAHHDGANNNNNNNSQSNLVLRALETFGVIQRQYVHLLQDLWSQGPALGGLMFVFTPGFVTARGALLVGFGFPAYVTMGALADKRTRTYEWWLQYFVVAVAVDYVVTALGSSVGWLPLFYHAKLVAMMWLQFPYFRGAKTIFDGLHTSIFVAARPSSPTSTSLTASTQHIHQE